MQTKSVHVPSMSCGHCVSRIKDEIGQIPGVVEVEGSTQEKTMTFSWEPPASWSAIRLALTSIGYAPLE